MPGACHPKLVTTVDAKYPWSNRPALVAVRDGVSDLRCRMHHHTCTGAPRPPSRVTAGAWRCHAAPYRLSGLEDDNYIEPQVNPKSKNRCTKCSTNKIPHWSVDLNHLLRAATWLHLSSCCHRAGAFVSFECGWDGCCPRTQRPVARPDAEQRGCAPSSGRPPRRRRSRASHRRGVPRRGA